MNRKKWPNRAARDEYLFKLHLRIVEAQEKALQRLLDEDPKLMERFIALWKEIDFQSFFLSHDADYEEWIEQNEFVVGEPSEDIEVVFEKKRPFKEDIIKP